MTSLMRFRQVVLFDWVLFVYRPFERTITMQKDSTGHIGFVFKKGKIEKIVKDSSAARYVIISTQLRRSLSV